MLKELEQLVLQKTWVVRERPSIVSNLTFRENVAGMDTSTCHQDPDRSWVPKVKVQKRIRYLFLKDKKKQIMVLQGAQNVRSFALNIIFSWCA